MDLFSNYLYLGVRVNKYHSGVPKFYFIKFTFETWLQHAEYCAQF